MPLFPEREKVRGLAFGREPCIDDRLPLSCALAKEKMLAEWLLNSKLGLLSSSPYMIKKTLFKVPKIANINFWIKNVPPPLKQFSKNSANLVAGPLPHSEISYR